MTSSRIASSATGHSEQQRLIEKSQLTTHQTIQMREEEELL